MESRLKAEILFYEYGLTRKQIARYIRKSTSSVGYYLNRESAYKRDLKKLEWDKNNIEKRRKHRRDEKKRNQASYNARDAKRRAKKLNATPNWLSKHHLEEIKNKYWFASEGSKRTDFKLHVDHIIPLQGQNVCGLHVPWNLQILTEQENCSKGNSIDAE